jgi:hypothetical protein
VHLKKDEFQQPYNSSDIESQFDEQFQRVVDSYAKTYKNRT